MQNFSTATEATTTALNSAGSAANENAAYMDSLEAKTSQVASSFEKLSNSVINSEVVKGVLDAINTALTLLNTPLGTAVTQFTLLTGVITGAIGVFGPIVGKIGSMIAAVKEAGSVVSLLSTGFAGLSAATVPVAAILAGLVVAAGAVGKAIDYFTVSLEEQQEKVSSLSNELSNLQAEYNNLSGSENLTAADERRLQVLQAQIEANEILLQQEAQKQYDMQWGEESAETGVLDSQVNAYNEATAEVQKYEQEVQEAQLELSSADWGSEAYEKASARMQEVQQKLANAQAKQQEYNDAVKAGADTTYTGLDRLKDKLTVLDDYQEKIDANNEKIIELRNSEGDHAQEIVDLAKENDELTNSYDELNSSISQEMASLQENANAMGGATEEAQALLDSYYATSDSAEVAADKIHSLALEMEAVAGAKIVPQDAKDMEDFISKLSDTDLSNLQQMLMGLGDGAEQFVDYLNHMDSADVARLAAQAVKNFTGAISQASDHMSEFEAALEKDYTEGLQDTVTVMDYIQESQTNGIKNWEAYEAALSTFYGTADEQLIKAQESTAAINTAFNTAGTTMGNYQQYFEGNTFLADRFLEQLTGVDTETGEIIQRTEEQQAALEGVVSAQKNASGLWDVQVQDVGRLAEVLGVTEPVLMAMFDYLGSVADINIAEPIDAAHAALIDLKGDMEGVASLEVDVSSAEDAASAAQSIKDNLEAALGEGAVTVDIDTANAQASLETLQDTAANVAKSLTDSGEWDFSTIAQEIKDNMGDLGEDVEIDVDTGAIQFNSEEAVEEFRSQFESAFAGIDSSSMFANFFENVDVSAGADSAAQSAVDAFASAVNGKLSTTNIAWFDSIGTAGDQLGASLDVPIEKAMTLQSKTDEAAQSVQKLDGMSLSTVTSSFGNATGAADELSSAAGSALSTLQQLSNKTWSIKFTYTQIGSTPKAPDGKSARGHRGYADGKHADGAEYLRFDQNETSLTGEEGEELLIGADGSQRLVGVNGPEFVEVKRGDTIIPANVTAMIKKGQIGAFASGRTGVSASFKASSIANPTINVTSAYTGNQVSINGGTSATRSNSLNRNTSATRSNATAKSSLASASKSAAKASDDLSDAIEKQTDLFDEQNDITEHQIFLREKNGASYQELVDLNKKYQDQLHQQAEWYRKQGLDDNSKEIRQLQKDWWGLEDDITDLQRDAFDERLKLSEDYIEERNDLADWGADSEIAAWNRVLDWMDDYYKRGVVDYEYYIKKRKEALKELTEAEKDALEYQIDVYETLFDLVADKAQDEIDALNDQRDSVEEYWNQKIEALEKTNDELDEQIEKEEALDALARARQTKVMVYKDGRFQYINDIDEVSEAQANLEKIERDEILQKEIENLEELRDKELASIDEQIEGWEKYKEEWASVVDDYERKQDELLIQQELGIKLEGENWRERLDNLESYVDEYEKLMERLLKLQGMEIPSSGGSGGGFVSGTQTGTTVGGIIGSVVGGGAVGGAAGTIIGGAVGGIIGSVIDKVTGSSSSSSSSGNYYGTSSSGGNSYVIGSDKGKDFVNNAKPGSTMVGGDGSSWTKNPNGSTTIVDKDGNKFTVGKKAKGTLYNTDEGINLVGENGPELHVLNRGDGVLPADVTKNLWSWGSITPMEMLSTLGQQAMSNTGTVITIQNFSPNLPNVQNGEDFANYMKTNFWRQVVQYKGT